MSIKDFFKNSVWEAFSANNGITATFVVQAFFAIAVAILLGIFIYKVYYHNYGGVVYSNTFAVTLIGMTVLTCGLTLAISSNIIISLGMVGALSIVRYRTAIKDPVDLLYLFWSISSGIMIAAKLYILAIIIAVVLTVVISIFSNKRKVGNVYILLVHYTGENAGDEIIRILGTMKYQIKSKTVRKGHTELTLEVLSKRNNTLFLEKIDQLEDVLDASLIQYNGEYNG